MHQYITGVRTTLQTDGYTELSFYGHFQRLLQNALNHQTSGVRGWHVECNVNSVGNYPDFTIFDCEGDIRARIEAKRPEETINDAFYVTHNEQLVKYLDPAQCGHPNLIVTNFIQFRVVSLNEGELVETHGGDGTLDFFENMDGIPEELGVGPSQELTDRFQNLIAIITVMDASPIVGVPGLRILLGQLIKSVADWFYWAWDPATTDISHSELQWANFLSELASNIVHTGDLNDNDRRLEAALMMGQLLATGLIIVEAEAQRLEEILELRRGGLEEERDAINLENAQEADIEGLETEIESLSEEIDALQEQLVNDEDILGRRSIRCEILPSDRHNLCFQQMALFSHLMGNQKLLELCQNSLRIIENLNLRNVETIEAHFEELMRQEFPNWISEFGMVPTEEEVVRYMVRRADAELRRIDPDRFGDLGILTDDPNTGVRARILDPACGTGRFYIAVLEEIWRLSLIQDPEPEGQEVIARNRVSRAIGNAYSSARVHALDVQPMCIMLTQVLLRRYLLERGINTQEIRSSVHIRDSLRNMSPQDYEGTNENFTNAVRGNFEIVLGNPPYGGGTLAATVESDVDRMKTMLRPWTEPYRLMYRELSGNPHATGAKAEIAFAFLTRFRSRLIAQENPSVLCFITPSTLSWSPNWVGAREILIQEDSVLIDSLGGQMVPAGDDGENVFGGRCSSANSIYTLRLGTDETGVRMRVIYPGYNTTAEKLAHLANNADNLPDPGADYPIVFNEPSPPYSFFGTLAGEPPEGPQLGRIYFRGEGASGNDSGMLPIRRTGYRFAIANSQHLRNEVTTFFGNASREAGRGHCALCSFFADGLHEYGNEDTMEVTFNRINPPFQDEDFAIVNMSAMNHIHVFVPVNEDQAKLCWDSFRQAREPVSTQGYLAVPSTYSGQPASHGFSAIATRYIAGHVHTAQHNNRCIPYTLRIDDVEIANLSEYFIQWLNNANYGVDDQLLLTTMVWDHALTMMSSEQLRFQFRPIEAGGKTAFQIQIPFPTEEEVFQRSYQIGSTLRYLQRVEPPQNAEHAARFQVLRGSLLNMQVYSGDQLVDPQDVRINRKKISGEWSSTGFEAVDEDEDYPDPEALQAAAQEFGFGADVENFIERIGGFRRMNLGVPNADGVCQRLRWVPGIAIDFKLGNHSVIKKWMAWHSNLANEHPQQAYWTNAIATNWYTELREIVASLTMQSLLCTEIDEITQEILDGDLIEWVEPAPPALGDPQVAAPAGQVAITAEFVGEEE